MDVWLLIAEVLGKMPATAPVGTRWKASALLTQAQGAHTVSVAARVDPKGQRREQYWCDGLRVEKAVLLRLTCSETECPHALQVRAQWHQFRKGRAARARVSQASALHVQPLMAEVPLAVCGHQVVARPARFTCFTPCPNKAHPPMQIEKSGFDLFEDGVFLGGGLTETGGPRRPRLPTVQAAEAYVLARQMEASTVWAGCVAGGGSATRQDPTAD